MTDTDNNHDDFDAAAFPDVVNAVLDLMPNGQAWRAVFAVRPGLAIRAAGEPGWVEVLHAASGDVVMQLHRDTFRPSIAGGSARVMVDAEWRDIGLSPMPDVPDDLSGLDG